MATIVTQTAANACHIQDAFRAAGRDEYPWGVYEAIFDYINYTRGDSEVYHLDVIAWCCDISETTLTDNYFDDLDDYSDNYFDDIDDLADRLHYETTVFVCGCRRRNSLSSSLLILLTYPLTLNLIQA